MLFWYIMMRHTVFIKYSHLQVQVPKWRKVCASKLLSVSLRVHRIDLRCQSKLSFNFLTAFRLLLLQATLWYYVMRMEDKVSLNFVFPDQMMKEEQEPRNIRGDGFIYTVCTHLRQSTNSTGVDMCERDSMALCVCNCLYVYECVSQAADEKRMTNTRNFVFCCDHTSNSQFHSAVLSQGECIQQSVSAKYTSHESIILFSIFSC